MVSCGSFQVESAAIAVREVADQTIQFYRRNQKRLDYHQPAWERLQELVHYQNQQLSDCVRIQVTPKVVLLRLVWRSYMNVFYLPDPQGSREASLHTGNQPEIQHPAEDPGRAGKSPCSLCHIYCHLSLDPQGGTGRSPCLCYIFTVSCL